MAEPQLAFFYGDEYRCDVALASRVEAIRSLDAGVEKHIRYADEMDYPAFSITRASPE